MHGLVLIAAVQDLEMTRSSISKNSHACATTEAPESGTLAAEAHSLGGETSKTVSHQPLRDLEPQ